MAYWPKFAIGWIPIINAKKSTAIFRPCQRKMDYLINIQICDNNTQTSTTSERKNYTKFVGIPLDSNLSWKYHFDYAASKIK